MIQPASPEQVREITRAVLERPEFRAEPSLLERFGSRLLQDILSWFEANPELAGVLRVVLVIALVAILAYIAYVVGREQDTLRLALTGSRTGGSAPEALEEIAPSWSEAVALARDALEAGDLRRALWIAHRVLLSTLDGMELLAFKRWKTNTDYLDECRDAGAPGSLLVELTDAYERVIYAHGELERESAARLLGRVESLAGGAST